MWFIFWEESFGQIGEYVDVEFPALEALDGGVGFGCSEGMWREGMALGVLPLKDPLEGIEVDIRIARMLNHV